MSKGESIIIVIALFIVLSVAFAFNSYTVFGKKDIKEVPSEEMRLDMSIPNERYNV